jgi:nucleoporin NDC1
LLTIFLQPISISHLTPDPNLTLVSGLSSIDNIFRYFAYSELKELAAESSNAAAGRRVALFSDQKYMPSLWSRLVRDSLLLLGEDYQLFLRRGKPLVVETAPPPPKASSPVNPAIATPTPLLRTQIYQSSRQSPIRTVIEALGSDGPLAQALDEGANAANIPELFRSVEAVVLPTPAKEEVKKSVEAATGVVARIKADAREVILRNMREVTPEWVVDWAAGFRVWWTKERISKVVQTCLPNKEVDVAVIEGQFSEQWCLTV